jgi:hypothetical protein
MEHHARLQLAFVVHLVKQLPLHAVFKPRNAAWKSDRLVFVRFYLSQTGGIDHHVGLLLSG